MCFDPRKPESAGIARLVREHDRRKAEEADRADVHAENARLRALLSQVRGLAAMTCHDPNDHGVGAIYDLVVDFDAP